MPSTKIINVLRDDRFDDILDIFRKTSAEEVIFVLPKKSRAFSKEESFSALAEESQELGKAVLILSENPEINAIATNYNFGILANGDDDADEGSKMIGAEDMMGIKADPYQDTDHESEHESDPELDTETEVNPGSVKDNLDDDLEESE